MLRKKKKIRKVILSAKRMQSNFTAWCTEAPQNVVVKPARLQEWDGGSGATTKKFNSASLRVSALLLAVWPPALENINGYNRFWTPNPTLITGDLMAFRSITEDLSGIHSFLCLFFYSINLMIMLISWIFLSKKGIFLEIVSIVLIRSRAMPKTL